jgi:hypothetical protein
LFKYDPYFLCALLVARPALLISSGINFVLQLKKNMKENDQGRVDLQLDSPSEANREKHINFREVEEESSGNFMIDKNSTNRQKQWEQGIKGGQEKQNTGNNTPSAMPMDEDDTLGVP